MEVRKDYATNSITINFPWKMEGFGWSEDEDGLKIILPVDAARELTVKLNNAIENEG
ncbi:MAG: hypothetical protein ACYSRP_05210 [Planctomycetota bacterium]